MLKIEVPHHFVIQSEAKDLGNILYVIEILPPYGRLNDKVVLKCHSEHREESEYIN